VPDHLETNRLLDRMAHHTLDLDPPRNLPTMSNVQIISMQDIRTRLASIADQAEKGGEFIVVRKSRPAFRIVPFRAPSLSPEAQATWDKVVAGLDTEPALSEQEVVDLVKEVRKRRAKAK